MNPEPDVFPPEPSPPPAAERPSFSLARALRRLVSTELDKSDRRVRFIGLAFCLVYLIIVGRLVWFGMKPAQPQNVVASASDAVSAARPDILDRNGNILATDVKTVSVFAEPRSLVDKDDAVDQLTAALPGLDPRELRAKFASRKGFVWVKRDITPEEKLKVFQLGLPGVGFLPEDKRVYPNDELAAHVLGFTNIDNMGIAGMEKWIDEQGLADLDGAGFHLTQENLKPVVLSLDLRATQIVRDELVKGIAHYHAKSGASAIMDVNTGEVIALASYPDFDPNNPAQALDPNRINRMSVGVYEMGSTFKALTLAMALDAHAITLNSMVDARESLHYGRFTIHDFEPQHRMLSVPEVFTYSSNIGAARIAMMMGVKAQQDFLRKAGQLTRMRTELPESADPILPRNWSELNTMTIAFGHGLAVAPLQAMMAVAALANGGNLITPTFLKRTRAQAMQNAVRIVQPLTSEELRYIMRLNAVVGSAKGSNIPGYFVGGKTGTADKVIDGRYSNNRVFTTFDAAVPDDKPKYLFMTVMDEPQAEPASDGYPNSYGFHTAAWNSGVVTGRIIERAAPLLGLPPEPLPTEPFPLLASIYPQANEPPITGSPSD
jgi:cell division protein FtsI (penicillin-binding protein 3)